MKTVKNYATVKFYVVDREDRARDLSCDPYDDLQAAEFCAECERAEQARRAKMAKRATYWHGAVIIASYLDKDGNEVASEDVETIE